MQDSAGLMMIEPQNEAVSHPLIDEATRKMTAAWRKRDTSSYGYRGFHVCNCGAASDNRDHYIGDQRLLTNSLCIHYLAHHRENVPPEEMAKVMALPYGEEDPTVMELASPR